MATEKRERQRQNRAQKQAQQAEEDKKQTTKQRATSALIALAVVVVLGGVYWLFARDDDTVDQTEAGDTTTTENAATDTDDTATTSGEPVSAISIPAPGATSEGPTECPPADGSAERITTFAEPPPTCIDPTKNYTAVLDTTLGKITIALDPEKAPETVNNFVVLARYHFYDGSPFHRIIPDFVIQGGDAVGPTPGIGNPGYTIDEEPPEKGDYQVGSVAMAKGAGSSTTGSQFFIITGERGVALPPEYSLFGMVTEGMDVVTAIESIPTTADDEPTEEIYILSATITES